MILNQEAGPSLSGVSDAPSSSQAPSGSRAAQPPSIVNVHDQRIYSEIRMFVVLKDNEDYSSSCL